MIMDLLIQMVCAFIDWFCGVVQGAWSALPGQAVISSALGWLHNLDEWVPVTELFVCLSALLAIMTVALVVKLGQKLIDWIPL